MFIKAISIFVILLVIAVAFGTMSAQESPFVLPTSPFAHNQSYGVATLMPFEPTPTPEVPFTDDGPSTEVDQALLDFHAGWAAGKAYLEDGYYVFSGDESDYFIAAYMYAITGCE